MAVIRIRPVSAKRTLRVFPRCTNMTPTDALTFIGDPPLWRPEADEVHVSCCFTWDVREACRLRDAWADYYETVKIGGPAIDDCVRNGPFVPGMYVKQGVTITSRGCPNRCPWCLVPTSEGDLKLLDIQPGWIVQDNNLLATSREHQAKVFAMLRTQKRKVSFPGGLDARLVDDWTAEQLRSLRIHQLFLAADSAKALQPLGKALEKLRFLNRRQLRCYALIGFGNDTIEDAAKRLKAVWNLGCLPFAQLYQPPEQYIRYGPHWKKLAWRWSRITVMLSHET